jgi:hypothetical protein
VNSLTYISEPLLRFGYDQSFDDPRNGLFFFGPLLERKPAIMRIGVVGTPAGISIYRDWVRRIANFIPAARSDAANHVAFPGFEAAFKTPWPTEAVIELPVSPRDISRALRLSDRHVAIYTTVSIFEEAIRNRITNDDIQVDIWFVVVPEEVFLLGRPLSRVPSVERVMIERRVNMRLASRFKEQPSLFEEDMRDAKVYYYDVDFHNQLKARLLDCSAVVQIIRETSLSLPDPERLRSARRLQDPATLAWNLATTSFFKAGGRPWKLDRVREKVCYLGIVFKKDPSDPSGQSACCGAQMFLDSGDGLVFKGALAKRSSETREFHLTKAAAKELMQEVLAEYARGNGNALPSEIFLHAKTRFNDDEWNGFRDAVPESVELVGVRITRSSDLKAYRSGSTPVLRGTAYIATERTGYLWTTGYVAKLGTYAGREVPNPLSIEITRGDADLSRVMEDVMGLTKVNFNACIYGDGLPVTLRFADSIGEILTAGPSEKIPPLPFRHYI